MDWSAARSRLRQRLQRRRDGVVRLLLPLLALAALQQTPAELEQLELALWPEYDRSAVLVIYRFRLSAAAALPAAVALPIPSEVKQLHALAYVGQTGELLNIDDYSMQAAGAWGTVAFTSPGREGQLEYYAELDRAGDLRSFRFDWPGNVAVDSLGYEVQQPPTAVGFSVVPPPERQAVGQNGLIHYFGTLVPNAAASVELSYSKSDERLSVEALPASQLPSALGQPSAPPAGGLELRSALPWALGGLGVILLVAGVVWYLRLSRPVQNKAERRRERHKAGVEIEASPIYCHNCGTRAGASDVYCRQCGTKLRGR